jgi:hypothetical protein
MRTDDRAKGKAVLCICTHGENSHGLKQVRHGTGRVADVARGCLVSGCGCANFVERKGAARATMGDVEISEDERRFALRRWRNLQRERRELKERYGFPDE